MAMACVSLSFATICQDYGQLVFLLGMFGFFLLWNFIDILQLGNLSNIDENGRYVALVPAFQAIGLALGPAISALMLNNNWSLLDIMALNSLSVSLSLICLLSPYTLLHRRTLFQRLT